MLSEPIVYVIDDDIGVRKALSILLALAGLNVRVYENAGDFRNEVDVPGP